MILYFIRRIISLLLKYSPSSKFSDILLWPISSRLFGGYSEIVKINKDLKLKVYGDMEDMVNKVLLFTSNYTQLAWEPGTARLVEKLSAGQVCVVVAGSHIGYYPVLIASCNDRSIVYAFEPNPFNFKRLKENVDLNKLKNIIIDQSALSDVSGKENMYFDFGQSSLVDSGRKHSSQGLVNTTRLDDFIINNNIKPDIIILDAEGYESKILNGGMKYVLNNHPDIIFELNPKALIAAGSSAEGLVNSIKSAGYKLFIIEEGNHGLSFNNNVSVKLVEYKNYDTSKISFINIYATIK